MSTTVIITVYKRTQFLRFALESVLAQTYRDYEVIVVDDSGNAASRGIVDTYESNSRIKYLVNASTLGVVASIRRAVEVSRGEFLTILNDDDLWETTLLSELVPQLIGDTELVAAFADHSVANAGGEVNQPLSEQWSANFLRAKLREGRVPDPVAFCVLHGGLPVNISTVFRKNAINWDLLHIETGGAYDYWLSCLLAATGKPLYYVPRRLARWRIHEAMQTLSPTPVNNDNKLFCLTTLLKLKLFPELKPSLKVDYAQALQVAADYRIAANKIPEARRLYSRSFIAKPRLRTSALWASTFLPGIGRRIARSLYHRIRFTRTKETRTESHLMDSVSTGSNGGA